MRPALFALLACAAAIAVGLAVRAPEDAPAPTPPAPTQTVWADDVPRIGVSPSELGLVPEPAPDLTCTTDCPDAPTETAAAGWAYDPPPEGEAFGMADGPVLPAPPPDPAADLAPSMEYVDENGAPKLGDWRDTSIHEDLVYLDDQGRPKPDDEVDWEYADHLGQPKVPEAIDPMGDARYADPMEETDGQIAIDTGAMPSNVELHAAGAVLPPDAPPPSAIEPHVDGMLAAERALDTVQNPPEIATAPPVEAVEVDPQVFAETISDPAPPPWPGPGTDTSKVE